MNTKFADRVFGGKQCLALLGISNSYAKNRIADGSWIEGIHFSKLGNGPTSKIIYNLKLIEDWLLNHRVNPAGHSRAIEAYLASLPSSVERTVKSSRA